MKQKYHKKYGYRYLAGSDNNDELMKIFYSECKVHNIVCDTDELFKYMHTFEEKNRPEQLNMFD